MPVTLTAYSRLHLGLLDTAGVSRRIFGGAGFSLAEPTAVLHAEPARRHAITGAHLTAADQRALVGLMENTHLPETALTIEQLPPRHVGLGTGTMLGLGAVAAASTCHRLDLAPEEISLLSGRGGASGIGWHSFWRGGFLVDSGQPNVRQRMRPSSAGAPRESPPLSVALPIPDDWVFQLLMPQEGVSVSGVREQQFFSTHTPTPEDECLKAFAALYHSIVPAVANGDLALLHCGLAEFQSLGLKKAEIAGQARSVQALLGTLREAGVAAGMSSLGPLIFAIHGHADGVARAEIQEAAARHNAKIIATSSARNFGHRLDGLPVTRTPLRSVA
ncbi:hypothetical protein OG979_08480 [Actinomadura citrea]|uniref:beta-ribofuranosylaminobenzene 5'-phosphate synthase family protein n=1 Tax=Actinomadura citrea TaxID=46158 RepID=UPI002E2B9257|nr:beta-ribofuranosylaminobenzene 5'-phosphate synthase family protein [Actinomadura citrea]